MQRGHGSSAQRQPRGTLGSRRRGRSWRKWRRIQTGSAPRRKISRVRGADGQGRVKSSPAGEAANLGCERPFAAGTALVLGHSGAKGGRRRGLRRGGGAYAHPTTGHTPRARGNASAQMNSPAAETRDAGRERSPQQPVPRRPAKRLSPPTRHAVTRCFREQEATRREDGPAFGIGKSAKVGRNASCSPAATNKLRLSRCPCG
jgi:hypothetical protein